jgi:prolyl oligopeptidase
MRLLIRIPLFSLAIACLVTQLPAATPPPSTEKIPVTNEYYGQKVEDNYQWLEKPDDPKVQVWTKAQSARTRAYLDSLPERDTILQELKTAILGKTVSYLTVQTAGSQLFMAKFEPPHAQPRIVLRSSALSTEEKVVFDPAEFDPKGLTSFDWFQPSPDGSLIAISLSEKGSESGTLRFIRVADGKLLDEKIERVQFGTAGGSVAWDNEGKGVYYTRYPRTGERPEADLAFYQQVYFHQLGTPESSDRYEIGKEFPRIAEIKLRRSPGGKWIMATVENGDGGQYAHYLRGADGKWTQLTHFEDDVKGAVFGGDDKIYLKSIQNAQRGQVLRISIDQTIQTIADSKVIVPEATGSAIDQIAATSDVLLVDDIVGGPSRLRQFDAAGKFIRELPLPPLTGVPAIFPTEDGKFLISESTYTAPVQISLYDPQTQKMEGTELSAKAAANFADIEPTMESATAADGTKIPVIVLMKKGTKLDGKNPTILNGYGSYGISNVPTMNIYLRPWFDRGGVFAIANIRGGGEFGEPWHRAGALTKKETTIEDFVAAARMLIDKHYTSPAQLGITGASAGGITTGGLLTQHPELIRAARIRVGVLDALRTELEPNGAFNTTEFGSVKDPEQFKALLNYSPYHRVQDGTKYPAVLFTAGENDHRVASWHAKKMTARLQAANRSTNPIFLQVSATAGHGMGTTFDERLNQEADALAFFCDQLGAAKKAEGPK